MAVEGVRCTPDQAKRLARIILGWTAGGTDPIYERVAARVTSSRAPGKDGGASEMGSPKGTAPTTLANDPIKSAANRISSRIAEVAG
ncbi:MAG: hypothetical protein OXF79_16570 [Chloroflexi bacterium]|nr:hypothetical protein [Chloroflexota bacterium]